MKIGILTLPLHTNYGGILQAYALQIVLERMGHEVCHIEERHYPKKMNPILFLPKIIKRTIRKFYKDKNTKIFAEYYYNKFFPIITQHTFNFIRKYIKLRVVNSFSQIHKNDYDAFVVGSDQIWRPQYYRKIEKMFLSFTKGWNVKRIAYAASFGSDVWEYSSKQTRECGLLLNAFNFISVREESGVDLVKKHFKCDSAHVLDPTMLLDAKDYLNLLDNTVLDAEYKSNVVMQYILDENESTNRLIADIASNMGLVVKRANSRFEDYNAPIMQRIQPSVESWIKNFCEASFVITDSFHATVFSILFHRPFFVFANKKRGTARIESLLKCFGLEDRIIENFENQSFHALEINWNSVEEKLQKAKNECYCLLRKSLED